MKSSTTSLLGQIPLYRSGGNLGPVVLSPFLWMVLGHIAADADNKLPTGKPASWLQLRGDSQMSGRSPGVGYMVHGPPVEAWRYDIAAWEAYFSAPQDNNHSLLLPFPDSLAPEYFMTNRTVWGLGPQTFDLSGTGEQVAFAVGNRFKIASILDHVGGLQRFEMEDSFADGGVSSRRGRLFSYDTGHERVVWETEGFTDTWASNVIVVDADDDGQLDIAVATHYRIIIFDGATGSTKMQLRYHNYRNYGWFGAANIDDDPYPEFAVIADFSMHAEVIDNDGHRLELRWLRKIQPEIAQSDKVVRPPPNALLDIDGDGHIELLYSVYNDSGDELWHIVAVDARSGLTRYDFAGHYLHGIADVDSDGHAELFVSETAGEALPHYAPLSVWTISAEGPDVRWTHPHARFSTRPLERLPLTVSTGAADGLRTVVTGDTDKDGLLDFFAVSSYRDGETLQAWGTGEDSNIRALWKTTSPPGGQLEAVAVAQLHSNENPRTLVHFQGRGLPNQEISCPIVGGVLHQWSRKSWTPTGCPAVTDLDGDGTIEVVVQTGNEEIICIEAPRKQNIAPQRRWQLSGRGQTNSAPYHWGLVIADLESDGQGEILFGREAASGAASLVAVTANGDLRWEAEFPGFDGDMPIWNFSGLCYWNTGNFRFPQQRDVFATLRRGKMGSEVGFLLDGQTGTVVWEAAGYTLPEDGSSRSLGGHPSAAGDLDGDGLDEIVLMWPDRLYIIDGQSGKADVVRQAYSYSDQIQAMFVADGFVGYAFPSVVDLIAGGLPELIWGHNSYLNAVLDAKGGTLWQTPYHNNTEVRSLMAPGDADGDGDLELLASTTQGVLLLNPVDGRVLQTLSGMDPAGTDIVAGDVDADGHDEFLFASGSNLHCVELANSNLRLAWTVNVGGNSSDIALADVNGDLFLDIVVTTSDGFVKAYLSDLPPTAVAVTRSTIPEFSRLLAPFPNPFNNRVVINYELHQTSSVRLEIFNITGKRVAALVAATHKSGSYQTFWYGQDKHGGQVASGLYFVRLAAGDYTGKQKLVMVK